MIFLQSSIDLKGVPTLDAKKEAIFMNFFDSFINIIDIDIKLFRLNKYTPEIHLKKKLIPFSHFLYT